MNQVDRIFNLILSLDTTDETHLSYIEQEIAILSDEDLSTLIRVGKKYRKTLGFFYERLLQEKNFRKQIAFG